MAKHAHDAAGPATTRRRILARAGALAAVLAAPSIGRGANARVVVVGGGWGGLGTVRALAHKAGVEITLVEPHAAFVSSRSASTTSWATGRFPISSTATGHSSGWACAGWPSARLRSTAIVAKS